MPISSVTVRTLDFAVDGIGISDLGCVRDRQPFLKATSLQGAPLHR